MSRNDRVRVSVSGLAFTGDPKVAGEVLEALEDAFHERGETPPMIERFMADMRTELERLGA
jgi:hypothetical protein